jgi:hypothetical protein
MGAASCATNNADRAGCAALTQGGGGEEAAGVYAETKIAELAERKLRFDHPELAQEWDKIQTQRTRITRMKTIALIDTRSEVPGVSLGILVSTRPDVMTAFAANDHYFRRDCA